MKSGYTFFPRDQGGHLHFVLEVLPDETFIVCHFTEWRPFQDQTCILCPEDGEHSYITKRTIVKYDAAYVCDSACQAAIQKQIKGKYQDPISATLLARIRAGALTSARTADNIKDLLRR